MAPPCTSSPPCQVGRAPDPAETTWAAEASWVAEPRADEPVVAVASSRCRFGEGPLGMLGLEQERYIVTEGPEHPRKVSRVICRLPKQN